jgi:hypothetical protein
MAYTTINKGSSYFNPVIYTGDGTTNQTKAVTFGFQPDWAWFKARDAGQSHIWVDIIRGGTKALVSEAANAEFTLAVAQLFTSTGMIVSNDAGANSLNSNGSAKVSWGWLGSNTTVSNTSGSITSTVSANTTSGFSVVSYTGTGANATIGHGLGVAPAMVIIKDRDTSVNWSVNNQPLNASLGDYTRFLVLDATSAVSGAGNTQYQNTPFTSTVFNVGTNTTTNNNTKNFIAYCFASIKGFSKIGIYTGNGSTDGPFIYTGFKPAYIMIKRTNSTGDWVIFDSARNPINSAGKALWANLSDAEATYNDFDILSNGFKLRFTSTTGNGSGDTYIYMAFAENPFVTSGGIPVTAR